MSKWLKRVRAVVGMGLIWAVGGVLLGGLIELVDNVLPAAHPFTRLVDMWPQTLAIPAFLCGIVFAVVLGVVGRHRRFEEFSLAEFTACGAAAGLALGALAMALGAGAGPAGLLTLLSAIGGVSSLALARKAERWGLLDAGPGEAESAPNERESRELLGRRD